MEFLGTDYGGWWVMKDMNLDSNSIIYSVGVGEDISFDVLLQQKYGCLVVLMDPTKRAQSHFTSLQQGEIPLNISENYQRVLDQSLHVDWNKFLYVAQGLWDVQDTLKFYKPRNESHVSHTLIENMYSDEFDLVPTCTLTDVMHAYHHSHIDLLKLDIEGAEIRVLNYMLDHDIKPKYVLVEFDLALKHKDPTHESQKIVARMMQHGYTIRKNDNLNVTFELLGI